MCVLVVAPMTSMKAQSSQATPSNSQQNPKKPDQQQAPPEAGGPQGDIGPIAVPKKKPEEEKPVEKPPKIKNPEEIGNFSLRVDVPLVNVDVSVVTKDGQFIPGLKKDNFRIYEDNVLQKVSDFSQSEKPITAVLLLEFAATNGNFVYDMLNSAYTFAGSLKKEDYIAVVSYDMKPQMVVDFTQDKRQVYGALSSLRIPGFSETNLFDALYDTIDRLEGVEGHKYIILISTGYDSFSKLNYDKVLKKIKDSRKDVMIIVGCQKVPGEFFAENVADFNVAIGNQPHSECASVAVFLDRFLAGKTLSMDFPGAKVRIIPEKRGKRIVGHGRFDRSDSKEI